MLNIHTPNFFYKNSKTQKRCNKTRSQKTMRAPKQKQTHAREKKKKKEREKKKEDIEGRKNPRDVARHERRETKMGT
jgi:hypothetical protein